MIDDESAKKISVSLGCLGTLTDATQFMNKSVHNNNSIDFIFSSRLNARKQIMKLSTEPHKKIKTKKKNLSFLLHSKKQREEKES